MSKYIVEKRRKLVPIIMGATNISKLKLIRTPNLSAPAPLPVVIESEIFNPRDLLLTAAPLPPSPFPYQQICLSEVNCWIPSSKMVGSPIAYLEASWWLSHLKLQNGWLTFNFQADWLNFKMVDHQQESRCLAYLPIPRCWLTFKFQDGWLTFKFRDGLLTSSSRRFGSPQVPGLLSHLHLLRWLLHLQIPNLLALQVPR